MHVCVKSGRIKVAHMVVYTFMLMVPSNSYRQVKYAQVKNGFIIRIKKLDLERLDSQSVI